MDWHDGFDPVAGGEVKHVVAAGIAAKTCVDVLGAYRCLDEGEGVRRGDHVNLVHVELYIVHPFLEVVDGVLLLKLEVALIVVDPADNEVSELAEGHENVGVASVEEVEASDGVDLTV